MNILFLCHRIPFPPNKGDKIRSYNELIFLSKNHDIYLATTLDEESEEAYVTTLERYCKEIHAVRFNRRLKLFKSLFSGKPFSVSNFYDRSLQEFVDNTIRNKKIDAIICFCSSMAEYVFNNPEYRENGLKDTKLIMDFVDLDSDKWLQYATYSRFPLNLIYMVENRRLFKYEVEINKLFDHSVFVSEREVKVFKRLYPEARRVQVIPNGVDFDDFIPKPDSIGQQPSANPRDSEVMTDNSRFPVNVSRPLKRTAAADNHGPILVFTGFMDYFANEDGVKWFCERIFPSIRQEFPHAEFYIVGNKPTNVVWNLSEIDGVTVTGYVDDIRKYYWMADACVIPLRIARGLQNKVLEAMATGNAVVASSNASDGIVCHEGEDIVIADDEELFANQVIELIRDARRRREMGQKAARNIRLNYSWETNLEAFDKLLQGE